MTTERFIRKRADNPVRTAMPNTAITVIKQALEHRRTPSPRTRLTGAVSPAVTARQAALPVVTTPNEGTRLSRARHLAASLLAPLRAWPPLAGASSSTAGISNTDMGIRSKRYHKAFIPLLGIWLVLFQPSVHASSDRSMAALMTKAEKMAARDVLSPSDMAVFDAIGSIPFLGFITPMNVMSPEVREEIRQRTVAIIRSELEQMEQGQSSRLQATREQLGTALQSVTAPRSVENAPEADLVNFSRYIRESNLLDRESQGGTISLYKASLVLERWGIDPYGFEAHPYYCALGIKAIDSMNVHTTRFCS